MEQEYKESITISYYGTDGSLCLSPAILALYLQDLAINHSNAIGFTLEWLGERQCGWAITNWHIKINRLPHFGEQLTLVTWADACRRMQAQRSFRVEDENGDAIVLAMSRWIFMDLAARRPAPITEEMQAAYCCALPPAIEHEKYLMPKPLDAALFGCRLFQAARRDTDSNGHVNNVKYIEWALDCIPEPLSHHTAVSDLRVVYRRECYLGDYVVSKCYLPETEQGQEVIVLFLSPSNPQAILSEVAFHLSPKEAKAQSEAATAHRSPR